MKKILVATDLSSRSDRAVLRAIKLAKNYQAHLTIVNIIDEETPKTLLAETQKIAKQEIDLCIKGRVKDIKHDIKIVVGSAHSDILKIVAEENIDLIVLGLHRHFEESQPMVGKVIERVIKNSMKPVLVVKNRSESDYKNILVGVDFNIHSKKSLKLSLNMFADSNFNLVHAYYMPFLGSMDNAALEEKFKSNCSADLDDMIKETIKSLPGNSKKSFKINKKLVKGSIFEILKDEITYAKPDLLVLGTHGRTGLTKMLSLNVTENFLANPLCDVLVTM
ncbi:MAG: universal stress protein [Pseudomonadota bacterium]